MISIGKTEEVHFISYRLISSQPDVLIPAHLIIWKHGILPNRICVKSKSIYSCYIFSKAQYRCQTFLINHFRHARSSLLQMECPVFLPSGKYDFSHPPTLWDGEKEKLPDCTYYLYEHNRKSILLQFLAKTLLTLEETFKFNSVQSA